MSAAGDLLMAGCMDLRSGNPPAMVGHDANDSIAAAEGLIDREVVAGELSSRHRRGLHAGPRGTSTVVLIRAIEDSVTALVEGVRVGRLQLSAGHGVDDHPTHRGDRRSGVVLAKDC